MPTCFGCNETVEWDPDKEGRSLPPNFHKRRINGRVYTLCKACVGDMLPGTDYHLDDYEVPHRLKAKIRQQRP
jgi:hypothetical protein